MDCTLTHKHQSTRIPVLFQKSDNNSEKRMEIKFSTARKGNITVVVIDEQETKRLRAVNRRDYEKRVEHNKSARANVALKRTGSDFQF